MKFLDDIAKLKEAAEALQRDIKLALEAKDELGEVLGEATRQLADVQRALADVPQPITVKLNGQELQVCERDALVLLAALTKALDHEEPKVTLTSGQTINLKLTDLEQLAAALLE